MKKIMNKLYQMVVYILIIVSVAAATGCSLAREGNIETEPSLEEVLGEDFLNGKFRNDKMVGVMVYFTDMNDAPLTPTDLNDENAIKYYYDFEIDGFCVPYKLKYVSCSEYYYSNGSGYTCTHDCSAETMQIPKKNHYSDRSSYEIMHDDAYGILLKVYITGNPVVMMRAGGIYMNEEGELYFLGGDGIEMTKNAHGFLTNNKDQYDFVTYKDKTYKNFFHFEYDVHGISIDEPLSLRILQYDEQHNMLTSSEYFSADELLADYTDGDYVTTDNCEYVILEQQYMKLDQSQTYIERTAIGKDNNDKKYTAKFKLEDTIFVNLEDFRVKFD